MRTHASALLATAFLIGSSCALAQPAPLEKDALIDSYEGYFPELTAYVLKGHFGTKRPFELEIAMQGEHWAIRFRDAETDGRAFTLRSKKYQSLHFERVVVVTGSPSPTDPHILVAIPFGEPQTRCFLNGEDVFRQIILNYHAGKLTSVEERVFDGCRAEWRTLPLDRSPRD